MDEQSRVSLAAEIKSAEDVIKKLETFVKELEKRDNNILTNLCSGLETFLGFNPSSKGYDGSGIVYSDLDRLCDAVMGFLSGVLSAVKDDEAVKTYDKYISGDKIDTVISKLQSQIGSGRNGLAASVERVKRWLEGYEGDIIKKTTAVNKALDNLISNISDHKNVVDARKTEPLQFQLAGWKNTVSNIANDVDKIEINHSSCLDETLKLKINAEMKPVKLAAEMLIDSAKNEQLYDQANHVEHQMRIQKTHVMDTINTGAEIVQNTVDEKFGKIYDKFVDLRDKRREQFRYIGDAIAFYRGQLITHFNDLYKYGISNKFYEITGKLREVNPMDGDAGGDGINDSQFKKDVAELKAAVEDIGRQLEAKDQELTQWNESGKEAVDKAKKKCTEIVAKLKGSGGKKDAGEKGGVTEAAKKLQEKADELREKAYEAKKQVMELVRDALGEVKKMDEGLKQDLYKVKNEIKSKVDDIKKEIGKLCKVVGDNGRGTLNDFVSRVKDLIVQESRKGNDGYSNQLVSRYYEYVSKYITNYDKLVDIWVDEIVDTAGLNGDLYLYVTGTANKFTKLKAIGTYQQMKEVIQKIKNQVAQEIIKGVRKPGVSESIGSTLSSIKVFVENVPVALNVQSKASNVISMVESELGATPQSNTELGNAVKTVLSAICATARVAAEELKTLTTPESLSDLNSNLKDSLTVVAKLGKADAQAVDSAITEVTSKLEEQLKQEDGSAPSNPAKVKMDASIFTGYTTCVNPTPTSLAATGDTIDDLAGSLPAAIKKIETTVNNDATYLKNVASDGNGGNTDTFDSQTFTKLHQTFTVNLDKFTGAVEELVKKHSVKTTVDAYLDDLGNMLQNSPTVTLTSDITSRTVKGLLKIKAEIKTLQSDSVAGATSKIDAILAKIKVLEAVPMFVEDKRKETVQLMDELEDKIIKHVEHIEQSVNTANQELSKAIAKVDEVVKSAQNTAREAITKFKEQLHAATERAFTIITTEVRALSAKGHEANLSALKNLLINQKAVIARLISKAMESGVIGLMRKVKMCMTVLRYKSTVPEYADLFKQILGKLFDYLTKQLTPETSVLTLTKTTSKDGPPPNQPTKSVVKQATTDPPTDPASKLTKIKEHFDELLNHLHTHENTRRYIYDHPFTEKLASLKDATNDLSPSHFANPRHPELLDAVRAGLEGFVTEMGRVYVNGYDDGQVINFTSNPLVKNDAGKNSGQNEKLTPYGEKLSKICLTILDVLNRDIDVLRVKCPASGKGEEHKIISSNSIGKWFQGLGYKVSDSDTKQNGELVNKVDGTKINGLCRTEIKGLSQEIMDVLEGQGLRSRNGTTLYQLLNHLYDRLDKYRRVCHLKHIPKPQSPTTVNAMLHWLTGLCWNPMYSKIESHIPQWYGALTADYNLSDGNLCVALPSRATISMKGTINHTFVGQLLNTVTNRPCQILIRILGHGHASGRYACDFYTNVDNLDYPSSAGACFDMFIDICMRLNQQLRFLYKQCTNYMESSGWRDCWYGRGVGGSRWRCNEQQCPNQECTQKGNQIGGQTADQRCDQITKCGLKSPLQSFLEDGLPGFLPHQLTKIGCGVKCSIPNHSGTPCITPMGFRDLSITASHTKKGDDIRDILEKFCGPVTEPLSMLCAFVTCLTRRPPQDLGDMFSFYHNFLEHWNDKGEAHKKQAFDAAVTKANLGRAYPLLDPAKLQVSSMHGSSSENQTHLSGDLFSLLSCNPENTPPLPCGQYLQPMSLDIRCAFTSHHASLYLSWVVYLTETFYLLLKKFRDEFCKQCNALSSKCHGSKCVKTCGVKYTEGGAAETQIANQCHKEECSSITNCFDAHATMYSCGFTFGSPYKLSGTGNSIGHKRTCKDFCKALEKVVGKGSLIVDLIESIDEFLWKIREYFSYTVVALWSASFLYLLYVYIGRLDTLHIRSHLRIPASHKITAQSLLAAARVGRLSKIAYLQP